MRIIRIVLGLVLSSTILSAARVADYLGKPADWFSTAEARQIGNNILSWQNEDGDWPKNIDTVSAPPTSKTRSGTFDNGATVGELRFLGRLFNATADSKYKSAFLKGHQLILKAQYPNGGWPQSFPPGSGYSRHITFNDDTFIRLAEFVRDVARSREFEFVESSLRETSRIAFEKSIDCILKTQIKVDGKLTAWCAQHDEVTLEPRPARTYELVSLSGAESAKILQLLMSLENPSPQVRAAVEAGAQWFDKVKLAGFRQIRQDGERKIVADQDAPALWARFYEIGSNRPIFSGRDGIKKYSVEEIEAERRNGYAWYGDWGKTVLQRYSEWKKS